VVVVGAPKLRNGDLNVVEVGSSWYCVRSTGYADDQVAVRKSCEEGLLNTVSEPDGIAGGIHMECKGVKACVTVEGSAYVDWA
jgi:hypothetical protein